MQHQFNRTAKQPRLKGTSGGLQSMLPLEAGSVLRSAQVVQSFVLLGLENLQG